MMQNVVHHKKIFLSSFLALLLCSLQYRYSFKESTLCNLGKYIFNRKISIIIVNKIRDLHTLGWRIYIELSLDDFLLFILIFLNQQKEYCSISHCVLLNIVQCAKGIFFIFCLLVYFNVHSILK